VLATGLSRAPRRGHLLGCAWPRHRPAAGIVDKRENDLGLEKLLIIIIIIIMK